LGFGLGLFGNMLKKRKKTTEIEKEKDGKKRKLTKKGGQNMDSYIK
jgi:hypothetical protein